MGELAATTTLTVRAVDSSGRVLSDASSTPLEKDVRITVNSNFITWIIAFFRDLFKIAPPVKDIRPK